MSSLIYTQLASIVTIHMTNNPFIMWLFPTSLHSWASQVNSTNGKVTGKENRASCLLTHFAHERRQISVLSRRQNAFSARWPFGNRENEFRFKMLFAYLVHFREESRANFLANEVVDGVKRRHCCLECLARWARDQSVRAAACGRRYAILIR